jgi:serine/threonine protein kinase
MRPEEWERCVEIFSAALRRQSEQRAAFIDHACAGDESLRREVTLLLRSHEQSGDFISAPVFVSAPELLTDDDPDALVGTQIGSYRIESVLGSGGMGVVYLALDERLGRKVGLKLLPQSLAADMTHLGRLKREARTASALNHPNIVTIHEIGEADSTSYIASELIDGETVRQRLARGPIAFNEAIDIAIQVASALAAAHNAGIVHRDIKPENIMLRPDGYVKVLDFGIAKVGEQEVPVSTATDEALSPLETNPGLILGTVRYMSPEQACPVIGGIDKRTDIWSLGVVLYEMVTGNAPFTGDPPSQSYGAAGTPKEVMSSILEKEPPLLACYVTHAPTELQQIVSKTLRKDRGQRYRSAHELVQALKDLRRKLDAESERVAAPLWLRWIRSPTALVLVLLVSALALALPFYWHRNLTTSSPSEKSIAVLPFENLSNNKENAFFADGVQDDLLTKLAKIADLKVISRTSAMEYRGARNIRQIGDALRVSHVLEGSVRRNAGRIHFNAQLIDTRTDTHVWAEEYDRDVNDMFAIESEVAQKVVEQLHTKISVAEKESIERRPTSDLTAFDLYTRAKNLFLGATISNNGKRDLLDAADLLNQAVSRDPAYFQAYCQLVWTHDLLYSLGHDHSPARLALAETAIEAAFHLRPDAGEAHLARAENLYDGYLDHDDSLTELEVARQSLPNDPRVFELKGYIERRQGKLEEALHSLERSVDLDPRNILTIQQIGATYHYLRRYAEENSMYNRAQAIEPNDLGTKVGRARLALDWKADPRPMHELIDSVRTTNPAAIKRIADSWTVCALAERDAAGARQAVIAAGENTPLNQNAVHFSGSFVDGLVARMTGDNAKARSAFLAAQAEQERSVRLQPNYAPPLCVLGVIDAALGRKEEALREGRHAVELLPVEKDLSNGALMLEYLAIIAAWLGDKDLACEELATVIRYPGFLSYGELKLLPFWDPLRGDPRFEKIVASLAPK